MVGCMGWGGYTELHRGIPLFEPAAGWMRDGVGWIGSCQRSQRSTVRLRRRRPLLRCLLRARDGEHPWAGFAVGAYTRTHPSSEQLYG
jgi:hypothetical protein